MFDKKIKCPQCSEYVFCAHNCIECTTRTCEKCRTQFYWNEIHEKFICSHNPECNIFNLPELDGVPHRQNKKARYYQVEI